MENYKRKYEQAMFRMNKWVEGSEITDPKEVAEFVFPELKESEDERIRKWLLKSMKYISEGSLFFDKVSKDKVIAWLEKPKYTEEDLDKAYKCADEVQYRHGYEDAKKEIEKQGEQKFIDKCEGCNNVKGCITCTDGDQYAHIKEKKPAWSEEDERILVKIQDHLREFYVDKKGYPYVAKPDSPEMIEANWLKSLKERMKGE